MEIFKVLFVASIIGSCQSDVNYNDSKDKLDKFKFNFNFESDTYKINLDSLPISKLPIGNVNLFRSEFIRDDSVFFTNVQDGTPYEPFVNFIKNSIDEKNIINSTYKYTSQYIYDFNFLQYNDCSSEGGYLKFIGRTPDICDKKIIFFRREDINKNEITINNIIDLLVIDKSGKKIDEVNISNTYTKSKLESEDNSYRYYKKFLMEKDIIKIKYIKTSKEEVESKFFYEVIYKILPSGNIVRWFEKNEGQVNNVFENGKIENHVKEGLWLETYGAPNGHDGFNISNTGMYSIIKYVNGIAFSSESDKSNLKFYVGNKSDTEENLLFEMNPKSKEIVFCNTPK